MCHHLNSSTQHPGEVQLVVAPALIDVLTGEYKVLRVDILLICNIRSRICNIRSNMARLGFVASGHETIGYWSLAQLMA